MRVRSTASGLKQPPSAPGLPLLGNSLKMIYDPTTYLLSLYQQYGSVFKVQMGFQRYTIMAGIEANKFLAKEGERVFSSESLFGGMAKAFGTEVLLTAMDGAPHRHMRKLQQPGFARSAALPHLDMMVQLVQEMVTGWQPGQVLPVFATIRRLVVDQLGMITTGHRPGDYFDDIRFYLNTLLNVEALKIMPRLMLSDPRFRRARARVNEFSQVVLEYHRQNPPETTGREPNMVDDILAGTRPDGQPFTEGDLLTMSVGPFFAGMDTVASTISFFIYALLKHPEIMTQAKAEVDAVFDQLEGPLTHKAFQQLPTLHAAMLETLRLYPATPFTPRTVAEEFEFGGYTFPVGTEVMIAQTITHFLPEYYPDPLKFDAERHQDKSSSRIPNAFAPYTLGAHTCLGAGMAEVQMMINLAALLRHARFELEQPDYEVTIHTLPLPNPGPNFKIRAL